MHIKLAGRVLMSKLVVSALPQRPGDSGGEDPLGLGWESFSERDLDHFTGAKIEGIHGFDYYATLRYIVSHALPSNVLLSRTFYQIL